MCRLITVLVLSLALNELAYSQEPMLDKNIMTNELDADVLKAITNVGLDNSAAWAGAFESTYDSLNVESAYKAGANREQRVEILTRYLMAKSVFSQFDEIDNIQVADFSWEYVDANVAFMPIEVAGPDSTELTSTVVDGRVFEYENQFGKVKLLEIPGGIAMPISTEPEATDLTAQFSIGGNSVYWSGHGNWQQPSIRSIRMPTVLNQNSITIRANSVPAGADIFINGKKFYKPTNVEFASDAGRIEIRIRKEGFEEWSDSRALIEGESWTVDSELQPLEN